MYQDYQDPLSNMIKENWYPLNHWIIQWIFQCFKVNVWVPLAVWHWSTKALQTTEVPWVPWVAPLSLAPGERVQRGILPFGGQSWWKPKDWGFHHSPDMSRPNRNNKHINCQHQEKLHLTSLPHSDPVEWAQTLPDVRAPLGLCSSMLGPWQKPCLLRNAFRFDRDRDRGSRHPDIPYV